MARSERDQFQQACTDLVGRLESLTQKVRVLEQDFASLSGVGETPITTNAQ
jgi:hypothetical protein